jgi:hypothetical protein
LPSLAASDARADDFSDCLYLSNLPRTYTPFATTLSRRDLIERTIINGPSPDDDF